MAFTIYGICKRCGRKVSKQVTTMTGADTVDGISYRQVDSKYCGCTKNKIGVDIAKGH